MRLLCLALVAVLAAPAAAKPPAPAVEVRAKSINEILALSDYVGELLDRADAGKQVAGLAKALTNPKTGIEGLDPARPFGFYATITEDVTGSPACLLIPVKDEKAFVNLIKSRLNVPVEKVDAGYQLTVPSVPVPVYLAVHDGYAYVTAVSPAALADDARIAPADFFGPTAADAPLVSAAVYPGRLPAGVVKAARAQVEMAAKNESDDPKPGEKPAATAARVFSRDLATDAMLSALSDGRAITAALTVTPKTDLFRFDLSAEPKPGTPFAAFTQSLAARPGQQLTAPSDAAAVGRVNVALPPAARKKWKPVVEAMLTDALADAKPADRAGAKLVVDAARPTLLAGVLDFAAAVSGEPDALKLAAAVGVVDGGKVEAAAKAAAPFIPPESGTAALNVGTAAGVNLHTVDVTDGGPFGAGKVWVGTAADRLLVTAGAGADAAVKAAAGATPAPGPAVEFALSAVYASRLGKDSAGVDADGEIAKAVFGAAGPAGRDAIALKLTGGEKITLSATATGKAGQYLARVDKAKKAKDE